MTYYQSLEDPYGEAGRKQFVHISLRTLPKSDTQGLLLLSRVGIQYYEKL